MAPKRKPAPRTRNTRSTGTKKQTKQQKQKTQTEEPHELLAAIFIVIGVVVFLALLIPNDNRSGLYTVRRFFSGIAGGAAWTLPVVFVCAGIIVYHFKNDKKQAGKMVFLTFALQLCLLSGIEAFSCDEIAAQMQMKGYFNFLDKAYGAHRGGGMLGALLGWPLTSFLRPLGALFTSILLMLVCLIGLRVVSLRRIGEKVSQGIQSYQNIREEHRREAEARRPREAAMPQTAFGSRTTKKRQQTVDIFDTQGGKRRLYNANIADDDDETDMPVSVPKLKRGAVTDMPKSVVRLPSRGMSVPKVGAKKKDAHAESEKKENTELEQARIDIEKIDLMEAVRREDPAQRNDKYIKSALSDHSARPRPVLTYKLYDDEKPNDEKIVKFPQGSEQAKIRKTEAEAAPIKEKTCEEPKAGLAGAPEKAPAMPKPSFFDGPVETPKPAAPNQVSFENPNRVVVNDKPPVEKPKLPDAVEPKETIPYEFPPVDLMEAGKQEKTEGYDPIDMQRAETLVKTLQSFSIPVKITGISHGPAVTRYELLPAPGIKVSRIASYADDISMSLSSSVSVRIEAPIPGKNAVGVEVPNVKKEVVHLRDVLESPDARKNTSRLMVSLGKDNSGKYIIANLDSMPHVLIAGQTGSGKSVCINAFIISILYRATPDEVKMIMIDPKMVELNVYNGIPHLMAPVVTDPKKAASALDWAVSEMTRRYKEFANRGAKNIQSYNNKLEPGEKPMPQLVIIVDELADLMMTAPGDVEEAINRLAQLARAAGIHMIIATQRPSVNVITGVIKANIPTRIAFTVASGVDSRTILDANGAEKLLGRGDMLYLPSDRNKPIRVQGAWVSEEEIQAVVDYICNMQSTEYNEDFIEHMENAAMSDADKSDKKKEEADNGVDELFPEAVKAAVDAGQASISMLQRKLRVGYARAGRLIDEMASRGYVSQAEGAKSREVLLTREQYRQIFSRSDDDIDL